MGIIFSLLTFHTILSYETNTRHANFSIDSHLTWPEQGY